MTSGLLADITGNREQVKNPYSSADPRKYAPGFSHGKGNVKFDKNTGLCSVYFSEKLSKKFSCEEGAAGLLDFDDNDYRIKEMLKTTIKVECP